MKLHHAFAGALALACLSTPVSADPISDALDELFSPTQEVRLYPAKSGWRRVRSAPMRAIEPNGSPLISVAQRYIGSGNFTGLRAPWCMAAMRVWLAQAGYSAPRSNRAIDGLHIGRPSAPHVGAVAVMRHHIGVVVGFSRRGPVILSGNHRHRVGVGVYPARRVISYRTPT